MYQAIIDEKEKFEVEITPAGLILDGKASAIKIHSLRSSVYQVMDNDRSHLVEIVSLNKAEKQITLKINGKLTTVTLKTDLDQMLEKLGMDLSSTRGLSDLKAPMPGLILKINISVGDEVKKGDPLLILEAMKMENVIKAPCDGVVKSVLVKEKDSVEKNQILLEF